MNKEYVLDIGIGPGGVYINRNTREHEVRVGVDISEDGLRQLRGNYPKVLPTVSRAGELPFRDNTFSRIEIVLPDDDLVYSGLQHDHSALDKLLGDKYPDRPENGWYPEFQRVLKPHGEILVYGDFLVDPKRITATVHELFAVKSSAVSVDEFDSLGTPTTELLVHEMRGSTNVETHVPWEEELVKVQMISKKAA